jgi:LPS sulfotransferase NodH
VTAYTEAVRRAVDRHRLPYEESFPTHSVVVLGLPSSGTRLVTRLVQGSGFHAIHDPYHGGRPREWVTEHIVIVTRDPEARAESVAARWPDGFRGGSFPTTDELREAYPDALEVAYEDIVADKDAVIVELAGALGVDPWLFDEEIYDANAEPGTREDGLMRPLHPGRL